jgi:hypothetical protein
MCYVKTFCYVIELAKKRKREVQANYIFGVS